MAVTHAAALRSDIAALVTGTATTWTSGTALKLILYTGTMPTNASTALAGNTAAATITAIAFGAPATGVATITASTADPSCVGGTISFWRLTKTDGTTAIIQGTAGTTGTDLIINSVTLSAGANVSLTGTNTYTSPA